MNKAEKKIPPEYQDISVCSCTFSKVRSPLEYEEEFSVPDKIVRCIILITKLNTLMEIENNCVKRIKDLSIKNTSKVIVHHEFEPFGRYIILLAQDKTAHILDYSTVESINSWDNINDISSEDLSGEGRPKLILKKMSGGSHTVLKEEFLVSDCSEAQENSRTEAIVALNNKLKSVVWLAESVDLESTRKEAFICRKISDISNQLQSNREKNIQVERGNQPSSQSTTSSQLQTISTDISSSLQSFDNDNNTILKVLSTRQRIVQNKWVICVAVVNLSNRYIIRSPELILHSEKSLKCLYYRTRILKTYQRSSLRSQQESEINVEDLEPPILKPRKKAFLVAICDFPDFSFGETHCCSGLITFKIRNTMVTSNEKDSVKQIPFPSIQLDAKNLKAVCTDVLREQGSAGLSFELFTLIAASKCHVMMVKSIASPLDQVIELISKDSRIIKAQGLSDFYCFYISECPPLHLASFSCKRVSANQLMLKTYTKDDNQALILIHNLKEFLPFDAFISTEKSYHSSSSKADNVTQKDLLLTMHSTIAKVKEAFEQTNIQNIQEKKSKKDDSTSRTLSTTSHGYEMEEKEYIKWRKDLSELSLQMEMLLRRCTD